MRELKPCPFCGQYPLGIEYSVDFREESSTQKVKIMCRCGLIFSQTYIGAGLDRLSKGDKLNELNSFNVWNNRNPKYFADEIVDLNAINYEALFKRDDGSDGQCQENVDS